MVVILEDRKDLNVRKEKHCDKLKRVLLQLTALQIQVRLIILGKLTLLLSLSLLVLLLLVLLVLRNKSRLLILQPESKWDTLVWLSILIAIK